MMINRGVKWWSCQMAVATLALGVAGLGIGSDFASAANTVGLQEPNSLSQSLGTNNLKISLSKGNPEDDGTAVTGSIEGVTIHLERLAGIDPKKREDLKRVEVATLEEIQRWAKDQHLSGLTDANGVVKFNALDDGIYLVSSTAPTGDFREINSFLVAVPFHTVANNSNPVEGVIVAKSHTPGKTPPPNTPPETPPHTPPTTPSKTPPPTTTPSKPPVTPGQSTTPSKPTPGTPGQPGSTGSGAKAGSSSASQSGSLALTGVQVTALVAAAGALIGAGFLLIATNRRNNKESEGR